MIVEMAVSVMLRYLYCGGECEVAVVVVTVKGL